VVRSTQGQINRYVPQPIPEDKDALIAYLRNELQQIQFAIGQIADGQYDLTTVAPAKPRDGMVRRADGVGWSPGGTGAGFYGFYSGSWKKLG
jgi:hypothetical protein